MSVRIQASDRIKNGDRASLLQNPVSTAACFSGVPGNNCDATINNEEYGAGCFFDDYHVAVCHCVGTKGLKSARPPPTGKCENPKPSKQYFIVI